LCTSFVPHEIPGEFVRSSTFLAKKFPGNKNEFSNDSQGIPQESIRNGNSPGLRIDGMFLGNSFVFPLVIRGSNLPTCPKKLRPDSYGNHEEWSPNF
jgi:hypothetical protein